MSSGNTAGEQQASPEPIDERQVPKLWINRMTFSAGQNASDPEDRAVLMTMMDGNAKIIGTQAVAKFTSSEGFDAFVEWINGATAMCLELQTRLSEALQSQDAKRIITPSDPRFGKHVPRA